MKSFLLSLVLSLLVSVPSIRARAQTSPYLSLGTPSTPIPTSCTGDGFYSGITNCYYMTISGCANTSYPQGLQVTYGYENPTNGQYLGTIVFFSSGGGTTPQSAPSGEPQFAQYYTQNGYEIVEFFWSTPWEMNSYPIAPDAYGDIQSAACFPATFLNFVRNTPLLYHTSAQSPKGFCAQGASAGSAALAYALVWYGAGDVTVGYLDYAELIAGPVLSNVEWGCQYGPTAGSIAMCDVDVNGNPQQKCYGWPAAPNYQMIDLEYKDGYEYGPRQWTNISQCAINGTGSSSFWNPIWLGQSIVNQQTVSEQFALSKHRLARMAMLDRVW